MSKELSPLEALKKIGKLKVEGIRVIPEKTTVNDYIYYSIVETALKALEIIKEKGNFISLDYDEYNDKYYIYDNELYMRNEITKKEYDLLKEVLEND